MTFLTVQVFALEEHDAPYHLATVKLSEGSYTSQSRLSDEQLVALVRELEAGTEPIGETYTRFQLHYLQDGVPFAVEVWQQALLPGAWRCIDLSDGRYLRLEDHYTQHRPVITL